jgi:D-amino-acid dehydrogenase
MYSLAVMQLLREQTGLEYGRAACGLLRLFRDQAALDAVFTASEQYLSEGRDFRRLTRQEMVELEPSLGPIAGQLTGAIHYYADEIGNAHSFCVGLAHHAVRTGVEFRFGTSVSRLELRSGRVTAAVSATERFVADAYVVAASSYSTPLMRTAGVTLPVQPVKGYSLTFENDPGPVRLVHPLLDNHWHAVVVPLEGGIRIAGTAEFTGFDLTPRPERIANLLALLKRVLPEAQLDLSTAKPWCGLRPVSADGVPIISSTSAANLYVNTGHGPLGWTTAAASGKLLCDLMCDDSPALDPAPFSLARFRS